MAQKSASERMSRDVIAMLIAQGLTQVAIARILGVTRSYISRVSGGQRCLTLQHLATLEEKLGRSIPLMLIESIPAETIKPKMRPLHDATLQLLRKLNTSGTWEKSATRDSRRARVRAA